MVDREDMNAILRGVFDINAELARVNQYLQTIATWLEADDEEEEEEDRAFHLSCRLITRRRSRSSPSGLRSTRRKSPRSAPSGSAKRARAAAVTVRIDDSLEGIDWAQAKADLAADGFDNGRSAEGLRRSFQQSQHVAIAWDEERVVGMARLLSDGVCNAYLVDVWTASSHRRRGVGSAMVKRLLEQVPGQHVGLQTDDAQQFYASLGFEPQPESWSRVVGTWLDNDAEAVP